MGLFAGAAPAAEAPTAAAPVAKAPSLGEGTYGQVLACAHNRNMCEKRARQKYRPAPHARISVAETFLTATQLARVLTDKGVDRFFCLPIKLTVRDHGRHVAMAMRCFTTDMHAMVEQRGPLQGADFRRAARRLHDGLGWMHRFGLFHLDLSPKNVLVKMGETNALCDMCWADFDLSRHASWVTAQTPLNNDVYILWHRAPELLLGDPGLTFAGLRRAEAWAFGCTLHFLNSGLYIMQATKSDAGYLIALLRYWGTPDPRSMLWTLPRARELREMVGRTALCRSQRLFVGPDHDVYMGHLQLEPVDRWLVALGDNADDGEALAHLPPPALNLRLRRLCRQLADRTDHEWAAHRAARQHCVRLLRDVCRADGCIPAGLRHNMVVSLDLATSAPETAYTPRLAWSVYCFALAMRNELECRAPTAPLWRRWTPDPLDEGEVASLVYAMSSMFGNALPLGIDDRPDHPLHVLAATIVATDAPAPAYAQLLDQLLQS